MRYVDFKSAIEKALRRNPDGLRQAELKRRLKLPYERACTSWVKNLKREIGLRRSKGSGAGYVKG